MGDIKINYEKAPLKEEHDAVVEATGRPYTQKKISMRTVVDPDIKRHTDVRRRV